MKFKTGDRVYGKCPRDDCEICPIIGVISHFDKDGDASIYVKERDNTFSLTTASLRKAKPNERDGR